MIELSSGPTGLKVLFFYPEDVRFFLTIFERVPEGYVLVEGFSPFVLSDWIPNIPLPLNHAKELEKLTVRDLRFDFTTSVADFSRIFPKLEKDIEEHGIVLNIFSKPIPPTFYPSSLRNSDSRFKVLCQNGLIVQVTFPHLGEAATIVGPDEALLSAIKEELERDAGADMASD